jgi:hypothetical protein
MCVFGSCFQMFNQTNKAQSFRHAAGLRINFTLMCLSPPFIRAVMRACVRAYSVFPQMISNRITPNPSASPLTFKSTSHHSNVHQPHPVYIVEVGAGHGKMGFLIVKQLLRMKEYWPTRHYAPSPTTSTQSQGSGGALNQLPFKYIMTDFTQGNVEFWRAHPPLQELLALGVMDFALFDAEHDTEMRLQHSGDVLSRGSFNTPILAIFNYVFDTLKHDAFRVTNGQLFEGLCTVRVPTDDAKALRPSQLISKLRFSWEYSPHTGHVARGADPSTSGAATTRGDPQRIATKLPSPQAAKVSYYEDETLNRVLEQYMIETQDEDLDYCNKGINTPRHFATDDTSPASSSSSFSSPSSSSSCTDMSLLMPVGGLKAMRNLMYISNDRLVVLAGDKAYNHKSEMFGLRDPHVAVHGSFSFMVNFDALCRFTRVEGGFALATKRKDGFKCVALVLVRPPKSTQRKNDNMPSNTNEWCRRADLAEFVLQWEDSVAVFGPDSFSTIQRSIKEEMSAPSLKLVVSLVRLSNHDPDVFFKFKQTLIDNALHVPERMRSDLKRDVRCIHANFYPLQHNKDVPFELGRLMMGLKEYKAAAALFADSQRHCGEHHVSWYNLGICYHHTKQLSSALRCFRRSLSLRPDYHDARSWAARVETALK